MTGWQAGLNRWNDEGTQDEVYSAPGLCQPCSGSFGDLAAESGGLAGEHPLPGFHGRDRAGAPRDWQTRQASCRGHRAEIAKLPQHQIPVLAHGLIRCARVALVLNYDHERDYQPPLSSQVYGRAPASSLFRLNDFPMPLVNPSERAWLGPQRCVGG